MSSAPAPAVTALSATPVECLLAWAQRKPQHAALLGFDQRVSYAELAAEVRAAAAWLAAQGVQTGDTLAFSLEADPVLAAQQIALCWGAALAGAALLPLYPGVAESRAQQLVQHFEARWWVTSSATPAYSANPAQHGLRLADFAATRVGHSLRSASPITSGQADLATPDPSAAFLYDYTSGTSGTPRLVLHTHASYLAGVVAHGDNQRWRDDDVFLPPTLWPGKVGLRGVFRALSLGLTVVTEAFPQTLPAFDGMIDALGVSCAAASPAQLRQLMAAPDGAHIPDAARNPMSTQRQRLRVINVTGAYFAPEEVVQARTLVSPSLRYGYGAAETGVIATLAPEDPSDGKFSLVPGMQVEALDAHGQALGPGQEGRLRIRSAWVCTAYARNPEANAESFKDGWFYSTDTGYLDIAGRLCLQGRLDDTINFGGVKIYPRDVEQALLAHPDVHDAAVIAYPEPLAGEIPLGFVQFRHPVAMPALRAWLTERLYPWQMPRGLVVMQTLPRTPEGKLNTEHLREIYRKMGERKG